MFQSFKWRQIYLFKPRPLLLIMVYGHKSCASGKDQTHFREYEVESINLS